MTFKPRNPNVQEAQLRHDESSGAAEAGCVVYLSGDQLVACVSASGNEPMGLLGQNVLAEPANLPKGFRFPGQLGSSDAYLGDPVMVAHSEGTWETTHYADGGAITAGDKLYAVIESGSDNGKLINSASGPVAPNNTTPKVVAVALNSLTAAEVTAQKPLLIKLEL